MKKTLLKAGLVIFLFVFSAYGNAGLIDNGTSTTNTTDSLEWLDLTATQGNTVAQAIALYGADGYRFANHVELTSLFSEFNIQFLFNPGSYVELVASNQDSQRFIDYFGATGLSNYSLGQFSYGNSNAYACISVGGCGPENFTNDFDLGSDPIVGIFLVRGIGQAVPVPEPSTLAIFALGMMGLASRRFKKQS